MVSLKAVRLLERSTLAYRQQLDLHADIHYTRSPYQIHPHKTPFPPFIQSVLHKYRGTEYRFTVPISDVTNGCLQVRLIHFTPINNHLNQVDVDTNAAKQMMTRMAAWLSLVLPWRPANRKCVRTNTLTIWLAWTDLKKTTPRPTDSHPRLTEANVNTAYTYACPTEEQHSKIVIYRREEWFKVFIHETFHTFGLDCEAQSANQNTYIQSWLRRQWGLVLPTFSLAEVYTETWARIWNVVAVSAITGRPLHTLMAQEQQFAAIQGNKVIAVAHIEEPNYAEHGVNVFAYYVLTAVLWRCWDVWIEWCILHNTHNNRYSVVHPSAFTQSDIRPLCLLLSKWYPHVQRFQPTTTMTTNIVNANATTTLRMTSVEA
jgi:hypothetical protein